MLLIPQMARYSYEEKQFGIYILGAGFSAPAGLPLASELWQEVCHRIKDQEWSNYHFQKDLNYYLNFKKECDSIEISPENVNFEEFLGFLDVEFHLGLLGSDMWSSDGNKTQCIIKTLIAQILTEKMPSKEEISPLYINFAKKLKHGDTVLTFNYDTLLERALEVAEVPYRLFPYHYKTIGEDGSSSIDSDDEEVVIYKLHGSIDWFDRKKYREEVEYWESKGYENRPKNRIFDKFQTVPLKDGLQQLSDPLAEVHRVTNIEALYSNPPFLSETPLLIPPSTAKILYSKQLHDFWYGMAQTGQTNFRLAIIGFSMALHDDYLRQAVYAMAKNYQDIDWWNQSMFKKKKEPVLVVDYQKEPEKIAEYKKRYAFLENDKTEFHLNGFSEEILKMF